MKPKPPKLTKKTKPSPKSSVSAGRSKASKIRNLKKSNGSSKRKVRLPQFFDDVFRDDEPIEIFVLRDEKMHSYVCDSAQELFSDWEMLTDYGNAYFALNPSTVASSRERRRLLNVKGRTSEKITRIRLLQIDVDPIRGIAGRHMATDDERQHARRVVKEIVKFLSLKGWPRPWVISSGNGFQILYKCDLAPSCNSQISRWIRYLDSKFSNDLASVDLSSAKLTQPARLPFSKNRKGASTDARPHRKAVFCKGYGSPTGSVTLELVDEMLAASPEPNLKKSSRPAQVKTTAKKIRGELLSRGLNYSKTMPPAVSGQHGHNALFEVACRLAEFDLNDGEAAHVLERYNDRCQPPWSDSELQHKWSEAKAVKMQSSERATSSICNNGTDFFGFVPDFALGAGQQLLAALNSSDRPTSGILAAFALTQFKFLKAHVPLEFVRQFFLSPPFGRNWCRDLSLKLLSGNARFKINQTSSGTCVFCAEGFRKHSHCQYDQRNHGDFQDLIAVEKGGELYAAPAPMRFSNKPVKQTPRVAVKEMHLNDLLQQPGAYRAFNDPRFSNKQKPYFKNGKIRLVYWPMLLLGRVAGLADDEIRAVHGITNELTRDRSVQGRSQPQLVIRDAKVGVGRINIAKTCPLLDPSSEHAIFGGNGRYSGLGYRPIGRTNKGWLSRLVKPPHGDTKRERMAQLKYLFADLLPRLNDRLGIIAVAHHSGENEWRGLDALGQLSCTESGFDWLQTVSLRFYAPVDWTDRWRKYLCDQLGYATIPKSSSEVIRAKSLPQNRLDRLVGFLKSNQLSQAQFARDLGNHFGTKISTKRVQRHLSSERDTKDFWGLVSIYLDEVEENTERKE